MKIFVRRPLRGILSGASTLSFLCYRFLTKIGQWSWDAIYGLVLKVGRWCLQAHRFARRQIKGIQAKAPASENNDIGQDADGSDTVRGTSHSKLTVTANEVSRESSPQVVPHRRGRVTALLNKAMFLYKETSLEKKMTSPHLPTLTPNISPSKTDSNRSRKSIDRRRNYSTSFKIRSPSSRGRHHRRRRRRPPHLCRAQSSSKPKSIRKSYVQS